MWWATPDAVAAYKWAEIPAEHLNAKPTRPEVEEAGAELLLVKRSLIFSDKGLERESFFRTKIYAERATENVGRIRISLVARATLTDCAARVVRPDGTVREYGIRDFPRTKAVERGKGGVGQALYAVDDDRAEVVYGVVVHQLQITDLQPGDIVELRQEINENMDASQGYGALLPENVQEAWRIRTLEFAVRSDVNKQDRYAWNLRWGNMPNARFSKTHSGMLLVADDVPAFRREKDMPPEKDVRAHILLQATSGNLEASYTDWPSFVGSIYVDMDAASRPNAEMKKLATGLVAGLTTPEAKLSKLHDYCQRSLTNVTYEVLPEWGKLPLADRQAWTAATTLKHGYGTASTITALFVALAKAAGLEATLALTTRSRDVLRADRLPFGWLFLDERAAAVKQGEKWLYYSPGMRWAPLGQWYWQNQGTAVLLAQKGKPHWENRPVVSDPSHDKAHRQGQFKLTEQGALTGEITETLSGQLSMVWRHQYKGYDEQKLKQAVLARGKNGYPSAKVSSVQVEDDRDNTHPVVLRYTMSIPDFATRAGERLVFAPNVLRARLRPRYTDEQPRLHPVRFQYGMVFHDQLEILLPAGYELEAGAAPVAVDFAEAAGIKQTTVLRYAASKGQLVNDSTLTMGLGGKTMFPAKAYRALQQIFEEVNRAEAHTLVLKPKPGFTPSPVPSASTVPVADGSGDEEAAVNEKPAEGI